MDGRKRLFVTFRLPIRLALAAALIATVVAGPGAGRAAAQDCAGADYASVGNPVEGVVEGEVARYFRFEVRESGWFRIFTSGATDTVGVLLDGDCRPLVEDDDSGEGVNFSIERPLSEGTYFVSVRGFEDESGGPFTLLIQPIEGETGACAEAVDADLQRGVSGRLDGRTPQFYRFVVDQPARYRIYASSGADTVGTLYGPGCDVIAEDDDSGDDMDFRIDHSLAPGTYYVSVKGYDDSAQGDYYLQFEILGSADECANAPVLEVGFAGSQSMTEGGREYFAFVVDEPGTYVVTTYGDLDTVGILLDESCAEMEENDDGGRDVNFLIRRNLEPGTYHVAVEGYDEMESGYYELLITLESGGSSECQGAQMVALGETVYGSVVGTTPYFYRFDVAQPGRYRVFSGGDADTMGSLYNSDCTEITSDDDGGTDFNFRITRQLAAGTYYVSVRGYDEETYGDYTLEVTSLSAQETGPQVSTEAEGEPEAALRRTVAQYFQAMRAFDTGRVAAMLTGDARSSYLDRLDDLENDPLLMEGERERAAGLRWEIVRVAIRSTGNEAIVAARVTLGGNQRAMIMIWRLEGEDWKLAETRAP